MLHRMLKARRTMPVFVLCTFLVMACGAPRSDAAAQAAPSTEAKAPAPLPAGPPKLGRVGGLTLVNDANAALAERTISFGQVFRPGEVYRDNKIQLEVDGHAWPTQMDAKARNRDGSVRHAILTTRLPVMASRRAIQATVVNSGAGSAPQAADAKYVAVPNLDVVVALRAAKGQTQNLSVNLRSVAQASRAEGAWIKGPLAQERRYTAKIADNLQVVFDVFTPTAGPARVDVAFHNDWTVTDPDAHAKYDVELRLDGAPVFKAAGVDQYPFSTWHRLIWTDGAPDVRMVPNLADLQAAAAVPRYDPKFAIDSGIRQEIADAGRKTYGPMSSAMLVTQMPSTGGRMDLGPLPTWAVVDLLDGDATTRKVLLANADAAGAIPWHIRDRKTGRPVTIDDHPDLWLDGRGNEDAIKGVLVEPFEQEAYGWLIDDAHQPSLVYLPYLLTGSQYYRDELAQQAAYNLLAYDNGYRGGAQGLVMGEDGESWQQVRGMAWSLRTLANAAYILPTDDPMQAYFDQKLRNNLNKFVQLYVVERRLKAAGAVEGWIPGAMNEKSDLGPWSQGFLAVVLTWTNDMGYPEAGRTVGWMSNFLSGLFTSRDQGLDPIRAVAYDLEVRADGDGSRLFKTWAEVNKASELEDIDADEAQETYGNYAMIMRAGLAGAYSITKSERAWRAYKQLTDNLDHIENDEERGDPTFAILPASTPQTSGK